tara:strand:- start:125 stop:517 length:393 start_codon:yes stop_codon:yes gene_type:complete
MKHFLFVFVIFSALISCNNDDDQDKCGSTFETAYVDNINAPDTGIVGETIPIEVTFFVMNGCGVFNEFEVTSDGNSRNIIVNAEYECRACTQSIDRISATYNFSASTPGEYELKFKSGLDEFIIINITIL